MKLTNNVQAFMQQFPQVSEWLKDRPISTQIKYGSALKHFCDSANISPIEFQDLKQKTARDLAWSYIKEFKGAYPAKATSDLAALRSFYRFKDGETLPFDARKGGKHYIQLYRKKAKFEKIPNKAEVYRIIDAATGLRDRAMFLLLFQSGCRLNVLLHLKVGHVRNQLYPNIQVPFRLKITDELDVKLRGYGLSYYWTFLAGEAVQALRQHCDMFHKNSSDEDFLFLSKTGRQLDKVHIWRTFKRIVRRSGFDPKTLWVHSLRKAFRKVVRTSPIDPDFAEAMMGHLLTGSRENYFDRHDIDQLAEEYMKINFSREVPSNNHSKMRSDMEQLQAQNLSLAGMIEELRRELVAMKSELNALKKS